MLYGSGTSDVNNRGKQANPDTHQKFKEAAYFLGKCAEYYHVPLEFQFNLNAFIQALRNITFCCRANRKSRRLRILDASKQSGHEAERSATTICPSAEHCCEAELAESTEHRVVGLFRGLVSSLEMQHPVPLLTPSAWALERLKQMLASSSMMSARSHGAVWSSQNLGRGGTWRIGGANFVPPSSKRMGCSGWDAHRFFGADIGITEMELDMVRTQVLLETDVDPSLIVKWHWNDVI